MRVPPFSSFFRVDLCLCCVGSEGKGVLCPPHNSRVALFPPSPHSGRKTFRWICCPSCLVRNMVRPCDFGPFGFWQKCSVLSPLSFVPSSLLLGEAPGGSDVGCARGLKGEGQGKRRRMAGDMVKEGQRKKRERKAWFVLV